MTDPTKKQIQDFLEVFDWLCNVEANNRIRSHGLDRCNDVPGIDEKAAMAAPVLNWLRRMAIEN